MILYNYETDFLLDNEVLLSKWLNKLISDFNFSVGEINYIFCDDTYLHKLNVEFLQHDTLTDIISFDNTIGKLISGDIFISIERIKENANLFSSSFEDELHRVMAHGVLHYLGFKDKEPLDKKEMTTQENNALNLLNNLISDS